MTYIELKDKFINENLVLSVTLRHGRDFYLLEDFTFTERWTFNSIQEVNAFYSGFCYNIKRQNT